MIVLGIETSCDETAVGIVTDAGPDGLPAVLADRVLAQLEEHRPYGGVVPEIAARSHLEHLDRLVADALESSGLTLAEIDGVAATCGPGLIGGVMVGAMTGKALALAARKPFLAVNHLEAHALTVRLTDQVPFPFLLLLVSGGHCQLLAVAGVGRYRRLGTTIDDAVGEAFDKTAKLLGLGYPGGPAVERAAAAWVPDGGAALPELPRPMLGRPGCDFSFSGLKAAVRRVVDARVAEADALSDADRAAIARAFQDAVAESLTDRCRRAIQACRADSHGIAHLVVAGGVAANRSLRAALGDLCQDTDMTLVAPPLRLCTDNGVMVAWAGLERLRLGLTDPLDIEPRPRWPLDPDAVKKPFAGVKA